MKEQAVLEQFEHLKDTETTRRMHNWNIQKGNCYVSRYKNMHILD